MIRIKNIIFSILLILVVSLFTFSDVVEAAKKKRKVKQKNSIVRSVFEFGWNVESGKDQEQPFRRQSSLRCLHCSDRRSVVRAPEN